MTTNTADESDGMVGDGAESKRYESLSVGDEEVVIFDRENTQAWIQSSGSVAPEELR